MTIILRRLRIMFHVKQMGDSFKINAVVLVDKIVNETAVRDVYITGWWDCLERHTDMDYEERVRAIARWVGRSYGTVRGIVDEYRRRKKDCEKDCTDVEENQLDLMGPVEDGG